MATTTTIRGITYNSGNTFTTAYSGSWYGAADGTQGSGSITTGKTVTFYEDRTGWAEWYYHPILCKGGGFNGGDYFWTDTTIFPYAKVTVNFDSGGGTRTYTYGTGGNFPSVTKTGYKHTGWKIDGVTYSATSGVSNAWISARNNQTKTATAIWEAQASPISSAGAISYGTGTSTTGSVTWTPYSSSFQFKITAKLGSKTVTMPSSGYITPNRTTAYTYNFAFDSSWINYIPNSTTGTVTYTLTTYNGNTSLGTATKTATMTVPTNIAPTVSFVSGFPAKSAITSNPFTVPVTNLDALRVKWSFTQSYSSALNSGTVKIGSTQVSNTSGDVTSSVLTTIGSTAVQVTASDKRGRSGSVSTNIGVYEYYYPSPSVGFQRSGSDYTLNLGGKFASVNTQNSTRTLKLDIYKNGTKVNQADISLSSYIASSVTQGSSTPYNDYYAISGTYTLNITDVDGQGTSIADISSETYEFRVIATDRVGSVTAKTASGISVMTFGAGGTDITIKKPLKSAYPDGYLDMRLRNADGNTVSLTSSDDLNDISNTMIAWCNKVQNKPSGTSDWGMFMAIKGFGSDADKFQMYFSYINSVPIPYMRWNTNGNIWYPWVSTKPTDISSQVTYNLGFGNLRISAFYYPMEQMVKGSFSIYNTGTSTWGPGEANPIFTMPSGYRPTAQRTIPMMIYAGGSWYADQGSIYASGKVAQNMTAGANRCYGYFQYSLYSL